MALLACGINHETADIALREQLFIAKDQLAEFLSTLLAQMDIYEAVVLSTCNRTEIYAHGEDSKNLLTALAAWCQMDIATLHDASYHYRDQDVVRHIMRVACGLNSMVVGEPQIFGQVKEAVALAQENDAMGPQLSALFQQVFRLTKKIRTHTEVGACPVSVASTAVKLAESLFPTLQQASVLLVGAGDTAALAAKRLHQQGVAEIMVASRKLGRAAALAACFSGRAMTLAQLPQALIEADIIFSATASTLPILGKGAVESAIAKRDGRPMLMIDIALPRDIEPEVATLASVHLYTIDDLKTIIAESFTHRRHAAEKAEEMIAQATCDYMQLLRAAPSIETLRAFRGWVETLREAELAKAQIMLDSDVDPALVMRRMAVALCNKLMHPPSMKIREAAQEERKLLVKSVHELFDLDSDMVIS
ncbi:MAG: glutamyl-tRNA reductase [Gammaproteobacteria bacterium]|nr:glutamyl-tRNA reductase [Gammaproteobacteria bacterium]